MPEKAAVINVLVYICDGTYSLCKLYNVVYSCHIELKVKANMYMSKVVLVLKMLVSKLTSGECYNNQIT